MLGVRLDELGRQGAEIRERTKEIVEVGARARSPELSSDERSQTLRLLTI
jgi:hypothetical protein